MALDKHICTFSDLKAGDRFIFRDRDRTLGEFLVAIQTLLFVGGEKEEKFAVNTYSGKVINDITDKEVVARVKNSR